MGRWSANHWKTAVFGWIAFVVVAVAVGGAVGTKKIDQQNANVGQSHRADQILKQAGFSRPADRDRALIQSKQLHRRRPGLPVGRRDAVATVAPFADDHGEPALAARARPRGPDLGRRAHRHGRVRHARTARSPRSGIDRITAATGADRRPPSRLLRRRGGVDQLGQGTDDAFNSQIAQAGERSVPLTLLVLLVRVRGARRRRAAPAARAHRGAGDDRVCSPCPATSFPIDPNVGRCRAAGRPRRRASTTRSSTSSASARSGPRAAARGRRSRPRRPRRAGRC